MRSKEPDPPQVARNLKVCIDEAHNVLLLLGDTGEAQKHARIAWLEGQLAHLVAQLKTVLADIEEGAALGKAGHWAESDAQEMVEDSLTVIANLKSRIQALKAQSR